MVAVAAIGMLTYAAYSVVWAAVDAVAGRRLEWWADGGLIVFGLLLALGALFVRTRLPGGLAFAVGAMLGLQALAVHTAAHLGTGIGPQIGRGALAIALAAAAYAARPPRQA